MTSQRQVVVIKVGGALVGPSGFSNELWAGIQHRLKDQSVVVVHGGGDYASDVANRLGHEPVRIHGRRVTSALDLEVVLWSMRGALNAILVGQARHLGVSAVGLSGADGGLISVRRRPPTSIDGKTVDFGLSET